MSDSTCIVPSCERKASTQDRCSTHFFQRLKASPDSLRRRFMKKVDTSGDCWLWLGQKGRLGYGHYHWTAEGVSNKTFAHRFSYELENGPIPEGLYIDHACHNASCVKPAHLRLATPKQNGENRRGPDRDSRTGVRGVTKNGKSWVVRIGHEGRVIYGGSFATLAEADERAQQMRLELFTHNITDRGAA